MLVIVILLAASYVKYIGPLGGGSSAGKSYYQQKIAKNKKRLGRETDRYIVSIKCANGTYISSEDKPNGPGRLVAQSEVIGVHERFELLEENGSFSLRSFMHGMMVVVDFTGTVFANKQGLDADEQEWARLEIRKDRATGMSTILSCHSTYVGLDTHSKVIAHHEIAGDNETFVIDNGNQFIALQAHHGKYVTAPKGNTPSGGGDLKAVSDNKDGSEQKFELYSNLDGTVGLRTVWGKFMMADNKGVIFAKSTVVTDETKFSYIVGADGLVSFKDMYERYLVADANGDLRLVEESRFDVSGRFTATWESTFDETEEG
jgi:hypothetical protein